MSDLNSLNGSVVYNSHQTLKCGIAMCYCMLSVGSYIEEKEELAA